MPQGYRWTQSCASLCTSPAAHRRVRGQGLRRQFARKPEKKCKIHPLRLVLAKPRAKADASPVELAALAWHAKFADQEVSFTDCVSFALMREAALQ
ncbi:MAG: hypothetical protein WCT12_23530 [Verrucomicrobiota bacterium]